MTDPSEPRRLVLPVRWHLAALAVGAVIPSAVLAVWLASTVIEEERAGLDARLVEQARGLSSDVDLELSASFRAMQTLAQSPLLDAPPDLPRFRELLQRAQRVQPTWRRVVLHGLDGRTVLAGDGQIWDVVDFDSFRAVRASQRPTVGSLVRAPSGEWSFPLRVPVVRAGELRFVLSTAITPEAIAGLIGRQPSAEEFTRSVVDARDVVVARTREPERYGVPSTPLFRQRIGAVAPGHGAIFPSLTLEGARGYTAVHRSFSSGWVTCVVLPVAVIEGPLQRRAARLGVTALGLSLVGAGGALLLGRRLSRAFASVTQAAEALAHGGTPPPTEGSSVREVGDLRAALLRSAALLRAREAERDQHLALAGEALREAEAASKVKDEFLAMLGHELRNPLAPLRNAVEVLRLRGGRTKELDILERQTLQLTRLVDDLLDVSRSARGQMTLDRRPIRLGPVVACATEMAGPLLAERGHRLTVDVPDDLATDGDPARLAQVVGNLVTNAAKYTPTGGDIRIRGRRDGEEVELAVEDDGHGIAPELLPRVFDLFVQGPRAPDRQEGGLGIGLSIARSLAVAHGGRLEARSDGPGKGSRFLLRLPAAPAPPPEPPPARPARAGRAIQVLVVDDNADAAETLADLLRYEGHEVTTASDGGRALEAARAGRFDVAVLDIGLPTMDGYSLAGALRGLGRPIGLVALTGYGQTRDVERARQAGFDRHFVKPPDVAALLEAVAALGTPTA